MTFALHGNLGSAEDWLAGDFFAGDAGDVEALDLWTEMELGLGLAPWAERFCLRVRESRRGETGLPLLAGYSLGGRLALHALLADPRLWKAAVIVSAHPGLSSEGQKEARRRQDAEWADLAAGKSWQEFLDRWNRQPVFAAQAAAATLVQQRRLEPRRLAVARAFDLWSLGRQDDLRASLSKCTVPVLWICGADDAKFSAIAAEMADLMPHGEYFPVKNCGHRVLAEAPHRLADAIGDFQKRIL